MFSLFPTVSVEVGVEVKGLPDSYGDIQSSWMFEQLDGCLVTPYSSIDRTGVFDSLDETKIEVYIPITFTKSLRNAKVNYLDVNGLQRTYNVMGDPIPYPWSPLSWNRIIICKEVFLDD